MNVPVDKQRWYGLVQSLLSDRIVQQSERNSVHDFAAAPVDDNVNSGKATAIQIILVALKSGIGHSLDCITVSALVQQTDVFTSKRVHSHLGSPALASNGLGTRSISDCNFALRTLSVHSGFSGITDHPQATGT
jgi:hypothetical protein